MEITMAKVKLNSEIKNFKMSTDHYVIYETKNGYVMRLKKRKDGEPGSEIPSFIGEICSPVRKPRKPVKKTAADKLDSDDKLH